MRQKVGGLTCWSSVISELKSYSSCVDPSSATVRDMLILLYSDTFYEEREGGRGKREREREKEGEKEREREGGREGGRERERKRERDTTCININTVLHHYLITSQYSPPLIISSGYVLFKINKSNL